MKRSKLERKTALRKGGNLKRTKSVNPVRRTQRRTWEALQADGHRVPWVEVRRTIYRRSMGRCERCGIGLAYADMEAHHRRTRRLGPDCNCNALALCYDCHHNQVHAHPERARDLGQIISRHNMDPASDQAVETIHGRVFLTCDGQVVAEA